MDVFLICAVTAMGPCMPIVSSNVCHVATPSSLAIQTNDVGIAKANVIVNEFVDKFAAAYNAKKTKELASLLGNESQYWVLERLKKTGGKMEIKVKEVKDQPGKIISATLSVTHSEMGNIVWEVQLQDVKGAYRLVHTEVPDVQKKNELLKDAHVKAKSLISAMNSSNTAVVNSMFKDKKAAEWVLKAMGLRSNVSLVRVRLNKSSAHVDFSVMAGEKPVTEHLKYTAEGFHADEK